MKNGFSLIELVLVLTIISTLTTLSVYGLTQQKQQRALDNTTTNLQSSLSFAQSNSVSSGHTTIICPSKDLLDCDTNGWSTGWITFTDNNQNLFFDATDNLIAAQQLHNRSIFVVLGALGEQKKIVFYRNGRLWPNGNFVICHKQLDRAYKLILNQAGRIRRSLINQPDCGVSLN